MNIAMLLVVVVRETNRLYCYAQDLKTRKDLKIFYPKTVVRRNSWKISRGIRRSPPIPPNLLWLRTSLGTIQIERYYFSRKPYTSRCHRKLLLLLLLFYKTSENKDVSASGRLFVGFYDEEMFENNAERNIAVACCRGFVLDSSRRFSRAT